MQAFTVCPETFFLNFVIYNNDSFYQELNWRENPNNIRVTPANEDSFELIDTTGLTALMQVRLKSDLTSTPVLELTDTSGITFAGAVSPNIILNVSKAVIASIAPEIYSYDMIVTDGNGTRFTLFKGDITIKQNISEFA